MASSSCCRSRRSPLITTSTTPSRSRSTALSGRCSAPRSSPPSAPSSRWWVLWPPGGGAPPFVVCLFFNFLRRLVLLWLLLRQIFPHRIATQMSWTVLMTFSHNSFLMYVWWMYQNASVRICGCRDLSVIFSPPSQLHTHRDKHTLNITLTNFKNFKTPPFFFFFFIMFVNDGMLFKCLLL